MGVSNEGLLVEFSGATIWVKQTKSDSRRGKCKLKGMLEKY